MPVSLLLHAEGIAVLAIRRELSRRPVAEFLPIPLKKRRPNMDIF